MLDLSVVGQNLVERVRNWLELDGALTASHVPADAKFLSYRLKVNEFAYLTTSDFVSQYIGYKPNNLWSGLKHLETHGHVDQSHVDTVD